MKTLALNKGIVGQVQKKKETKVAAKVLPKSERHIQLLQELKTEFDMADWEIAKLLEATAPIISDVRAGRRQLTFAQELRAYNRLGYAWARDAMLAMLPDETHDKLLKKDQDRTKAVLNKPAKKPVIRRRKTDADVVGVEVDRRQKKV